MIIEMIRTMSKIKMVMTMILMLTMIRLVIQEKAGQRITVILALSLKQRNSFIKDKGDLLNTDIFIY